MAAPEATSAKEALKFFGASFAFLLAGGVALVVNSPDLAAGGYASSAVIGGLHLITLGWLSLSILGALQVFLGVALGALPFGKSLSGWIRRAWIAGTLLFAGGMGFQLPALIAGGAGVLGVALALFSVQLVPALWGAKRGQLTRAFASIAVVSLWLVWLLGGAAALARAGNPIGALPPGYLGAHILIAVFGWVGAMIAGVGSHLVPMFALSRPTSQVAIRIAAPVWASVPVLGAISAYVPTPFAAAGWSMAAAASGLWCLQLVLFFRARIRKERDPGLLLAALATAFLPVSWGMLLITGNPVAFVGTLVLGWLTLFTLGIYHRVVPFLVWFTRFSGGMGKRKLPRVKDLISERLAMTTAIGGPAAVALWATGAGTGSLSLLYAGSTLLVLAVLSAAGQVSTLVQKEFSNEPVARGDFRASQSGHRP